MSAAVGQTPVFLQTGFRTGGTWLWSRFRANPASLCFCEPLNEALEQVTPEVIASLTPDTSNLRHPTLDAPYFQELLPLLNESGHGIRGYRACFGLDSYFAPPEEQPSGLAEYLQSLVDLAIAGNRRPVLKFTRALGRAAWLRSCFPDARQIALFRDPWRQFQSAMALRSRHDNCTFLMIPLFAISRARSGALKTLCERLHIPDVPLSSGIERCAGAYTRLAREMPVSDLFSAFLAMYIASHARSVPYVDFLVDQDTLTRSQYRRHVEAEIRAMTGLNVDLSGYAADTVAALPAASGFDVHAASGIVYGTLREDYPGSVDFAQDKMRQTVLL